MKIKGDNLPEEIFKIVGFYYLNVLPALVRYAIYCREEKIHFGETWL